MNHSKRNQKRFFCFFLKTNFRTKLRLLKFYSNNIDNQYKHTENERELEKLTETQRKREGRICREAVQRGG
jgi:hypothetical protein